MDTGTKIIEIFEKMAQKCVSLHASINKNTNGYDFEKEFREEMISFEQEVYREMLGEEKVNKMKE